MYAAYRVFINTTQGNYFAAASNSVNGLADLVRAYFDTTTGRAIYDDQIRGVTIMNLDRDTGSYVRSGQATATSRQDVINKLYELGGR